MKQCPVCRKTNLNVESCSRCGTPIQGFYLSPWLGLNLVLPGLTPLWKGKFLIGSLGMFVSFLVYGYLLRIGVGLEQPVRSVIWALLWLPWALGWTWYATTVRRQYWSAREVVRFLIGLLIVGNLVLSIAIGITLLGLYQF